MSVLANEMKCKKLYKITRIADSESAASKNILSILHLHKILGMTGRCQSEIVIIRLMG